MSCLNLLHNESRSLREEICHIQALSKQIGDEISRLDTTSLDEQEIEYQNIKSDLVEVKRRHILLVENVLKKREESVRQGRAVLAEVENYMNAANQKYNPANEK